MAGVLLGLDIGTSSIKACLADAETGRRLAAATSPSDVELPIMALQPGWAEQDPRDWWAHVVSAVRLLPAQLLEKVEAIGIGYQMHGLVLVDSTGEPTRDAIIWCDSRAAKIGQRAFLELGEEFCLRHLLGSPGNFTASKIRWVLENEPLVLSASRWAMLPGDFIAMKLTGEAATTATGLSEMILWDFQEGCISKVVLQAFEIPESLLPPVVPCFGLQGLVNAKAAAELGIAAGTAVTYRAGDQPNNALALNALEPGEVASTAGTSGVIYSVTDKPFADREQRVNTFLHVNHTPEAPRYGVLCCINGCGSMLSWLKHRLFDNRLAYGEIDSLAATVGPGSEGLVVHPFGNGAERILANRDPGAQFIGINFARHGEAHLCRAVQEGIAFAMKYGTESRPEVKAIRAANSNLYLSPVFAQTMATATGATVEILDSDGALGAAQGAGRGLSGQTSTWTPKVIRRYEPIPDDQAALTKAYEKWVSNL